MAAQEVRDKVNTVLRDLPEDIDPPLVLKVDPDAAPILTIGLRGTASRREITEYADKVLRRRLESLSGVGQVQVRGGLKRQINVVVDPLKLRSYKLTVNDVSRALAANNSEFPGGSVKEGPKEYSLRTLGRVDKPGDLAMVPVAQRDGHVVTVGDVATVEDGVEEQTDTLQLNDEPIVTLDVSKQSGGNTVAVAEAVMERIEELKSTLPEGYETVILRDSSVFVKDSITSVKTHLIEGSIFAAIIVLLFLRNFRTTFISALAIPTSIISTFAVMWYMGFTLNILTLLALTLSVGIVIDDAIVVLENIYRFIEEKKMRAFDAAIAATKEIGLAVMVITLSLVAVFLPIAFMSGIVGRFMQSFGITMAAAVVVSLLVSFTLTPMLSARWLKRHEHHPHHHEGDVPSGVATAEANVLPDAVQDDDDDEDPARRGLYGIVERLYMVMLRFSLHHRWVIILACVAAMAAVPPLLKVLPKNFLPQDDRNEFNVSVRAPEGMSLEATSVIVGRISDDIRNLSGVRYTVASTGAGALSNEGSIFVSLVEAKERDFSQFDFMDYIRKNVLAGYEKRDQVRTAASEADDIATGGVNAPVMFAVRGPDIKKLAEYSEALKKALAEVPGAVDVDSTLKLGKPEYGVVVDRAKAADLGVDIAFLARSLRLLVAGEKVTDYTEKGERYDVHVRAAADRRSNPDILNLITVPSTKLGSVSLADMVTFREDTGPSEINRSGRQREVIVYANLETGASTQDMIDKLNETAMSLNMGPEYSTGLEGQSKEMAKTGMAFLLTFLTAFIFMYLVIAAQFESWLHPITILMALPLTIPFALLGLLIFQQGLNIFTLLGMLVLFAVVKKNSILQIDHTIQLRAEGLPKEKAILQANRDRLRPILMTTIAFVAGMLPLLLSQSTGSGTNRAISSIIIGGQTLSLALTLLAVPVFYSLFDDLAAAKLGSKAWRAITWLPRRGLRWIR
ncbi:AcrB/AcrD/AcrF family protein [candidate division BRC1 bacterium HGW-BRC1-1]|nr:MAG: AcrB/AcrD/AcrF family protein [candidate division BRC1 bacterium HGW-BRC1-1]